MNVFLLKAYSYIYNSFPNILFMIDFTKTFETQRIILRPLKQEDKEHFIKITTDKKLWIYFTSDLSDKLILSEWLDAGIQDINNKKRLALSIIHRDRNSLIGSTSLGNISDIDKRAEIGWTWICRDFQGKGLNDEAKYLLIKYCFDDLHYERVEFKTDVLNLPARNALKRIGASEEGVLRSHTLMTHHRRRDTIYYSILRSEWEEIKVKNNWPQ